MVFVGDSDMKITDLHYYECIYNVANEIDDIIARLYYPQKYLQLKINDKLYDLEVESVDKDKFILIIKDGKNIMVDDLNGIR